MASHMCSLCSDNMAKLRFQCGHICCQDCFNQKFESDSSYPVECFSCSKFLIDKECLKFLNKSNQKIYKAKKYCLTDILDKFLYKCFSENCKGEYRHYESNSLINFICPKCKKRNCVKCRAIHKKKENCKTWRRNHQDIVQERIKSKAEIDKKIKLYNAMYCVKCGILCERDGGCYGVKCPVCKTSLCFITQKARWGPAGYGDISDGCQCRPNRKCDKNCIGCTPDRIIQPLSYIQTLRIFMNMCPFINRRMITEN